MNFNRLNVLGSQTYIKDTAILMYWKINVFWKINYEMSFDLFRAMLQIMEFTVLQPNLVAPGDAKRKTRTMIV